MADASGPSQLFEQWRKQFEEGAQAWSRLITQTAAASPSPTPDPTAFWRPVLDQGVQTWAKLFAQTPATPELLTQWKQFLDQWIEAWSKVLGQAMGTEQFAKLMGQSLDQILVASRAGEEGRRSADRAGAPGAEPSVAQPADRVAKQLVELEDRIDRLEESISAKLRRLSEREPR